MRRIVYVIFVLLIALQFAGCNKQASEPVNTAGWIAISDGKLYLDETKVYIMEATNERWPEGIYARHAGENVEVVDYAIDDGYDVEILNKDIRSFEITDETVFEFIDTTLLFLKDAPFGSDRRYRTTSVDEFLEYRGNWSKLSCSLDESYVMTPEDFLLHSRDCVEHRYPIVFVRVKDGKVVSVTEEFLFTQ